MLGHKILVAVVAVGIGIPAIAQEPDGPGRGVARISLLNGDVSVRRGDSGDFVAAALNAPLVVQDRVLTGPGSRTEVQFDWANFLRASGNAEVRLAELEQNRYMVQIARGTVTWRVLRDRDVYVEISTPNVSVRPVKRGIYRVTVGEDGTTEITVRSGEAEIFTPQGSERLRSGKTMMARGSAASPEFRVGDDIPTDDWDRWNVARDRDLERSQSYRYVSQDIYGAEDLDDHGMWTSVPNYGWVWAPRVARGWAPYRSGRWAWMDFYGWNWISHDPWGWAPYHYGRWFFHAPVGWCWWPGAMGGRHRWSPGLVAFVGFGRVGVGVGIGGGWGRVGWIPLAPWERFDPWWGNRWYGGWGGRNRTVIDNSVTVVNNVNVTNIYRNSRVDNGVTVVNEDGFRRGRMGETVRVTSDELRTASVARGPLPVAPGRESLRMADREAAVRGVEGGRSADRFYSARRPVEVERVSFEDQRRGVEQIARRSFGETSASGVSQAPAGRTADTGSRSESQRGWRQADGSGTTGRGAADTGSGRSAEGVAGRGVTSESTGRSAGRESDSGVRGAGSGRTVESGGGRTAESVRPSESTGRSADRDSGWRTFGSGRTSESGGTRGADATTGRSAERSTDWRGSGSGRSAESGSSRNSEATTGRGASSDSDWRRFGGGRTSGNSESGVGRGVESAPRSSERSADPGVGRSGDRGGSSGRVAPSNEQEGDWRRFGSARSEGSGGVRGDTGSSRSFGEPVSPRGTDGTDWRRSEGSTGRSESRSADRSGDSIRISPPIVRERGDSGGSSRSAPSYDGGSRGSYGGGERSAPSYDGGSRGSYGSGGRSAPSYDGGSRGSSGSSRSAPSYDGGSRGSSSGGRSAPSYDGGSRGSSGGGNAPSGGGGSRGGDGGGASRSGGGRGR